MRFASPLFLGRSASSALARRTATATSRRRGGGRDRRADGGLDPFQGPDGRVAKALGDGTGFFQLYTPTDEGLTESLVQRAEAAGFKAIVVTLDTWPWAGGRAISTPPISRSSAALRSRTISATQFPRAPREAARRGPAAAIQIWASIFGRPLTWADLPWLRSLTKLPLILKGICHPDDARRAIDAGADAIYCSNHGGRQANGGVRDRFLPRVVAACGKTPVLFDSGVRSGADIVKALALGATMVGVGRPYAYGLALDGAAGVAHVLRCLLAETDIVMAIDGYPTLADLTPAVLVRV